MKTAVKLTLLFAFCCSIGVARAADDPKATPATPDKSASAAPKTDTPAADPEKKAKGRLPANFGKVVSDTQKAKIYQIQGDYAPKIKALREQLAALTAQQDKEMRAVLTPEQVKKLDELTAEAKAKRKAKAAETAAKQVEPAKPTTTTPAKPTETAPPVTK